MNTYTAALKLLLKLLFKLFSRVCIIKFWEKFVFQQASLKVELWIKVAQNSFQHLDFDGSL